jgi:serine/threonine-protein kinase
MSLPSGAKLGPYEVLAPLGAGGMGEVYRARDTRLDRTVAIKVLPSDLSSNPDLRQRFEREARAVSSLNHPNICTLHDIGHQDGVDYLVLEFLEGESLHDRLGRGPLPLDQALRCAIQIGDALDKAHRSGVVHRDLKPGNVMLTKTGAKLLDFGLAKRVEPIMSGDGDFSTFATRSKALTEKGRLLGTIPYMSPEQLEGGDADARTDIWALGQLLYEMVTGQRAFVADSIASLIGAILKDEPRPIRELKSMTPASLERLVKTCLAKDPDERWQCAHDVVAELRWIAEPGSAAGGAPVTTSASSRSFRRARAWTLVALGLLAVIAAALAWRARPIPAELSTSRAVIPLAGPLALGLPSLAISPNGSRLAYVVSRGGGSVLHLRAMNRLEAQPLDDTEPASDPFFSPDGQWLGFFAFGVLKKVSLSGGAALSLGAAALDRGASWGSGEEIVLSSGLRSGLQRLPARGGNPEVLTTPDLGRNEKTHRWPQVLPGRTGVLFTVGTATISTFDDARIEVLDTRTGARRVLLEGGSDARYVPTGHLVYARAGSLLAVPFDIEGLELRGPAVPVLQGVITSPLDGHATFSISGNGTLVYAAGTADVYSSDKLLLVDRGGRVQAPALVGRALATGSGPRISPDGDRALLGIDGASQQLWMLDVARGTLTRLTFAWDNLSAIWTPDGQRITFTSNRDGPLNLYWQPVDGNGPAERLTESPYIHAAGSWSPDGRVLVFTEAHPDTGVDIWTLRLDGDRKPEPLLRGPFNEQSPRISPDGGWLAYTSDESGQREVYVQPFPGPGGKRQLSTEGGATPVWSRDGREIFYLQGGRMMAVDVTLRPAFSAGRPRLLFEKKMSPSVPASLQVSVPGYDVAPDGHFLLRESNPEAPTQLIVVFNWFEELKGLMAAANR